MLFLLNKYTKWYFNIINSAKNRVTTGYVEKHHIIPKVLGGSNSKDNIVKLTAREHFICHLLLTKMLIDENRHKMVYALHMLSNASNKSHYRYVPSSKLYEYERNIFAETHSLRMKQNHPLSNPINKTKWEEAMKKRKPTSVKGRKHKPESIEKMKNKKWSEKALQNRLENCLKAAEKRKGTKWSEQKREQMFNNYIEKNKHIFPKVIELNSQGINTRQISLKLGISWDRVNYILVNQNKLNTI